MAEDFQNYSSEAQMIFSTRNFTIKTSRALPDKQTACMDALISYDYKHVNQYVVTKKRLYLHHTPFVNNSK